MKLYRFDYSPFVRKVQMALDLIGAVDTHAGRRLVPPDLAGV